MPPLGTFDLWGHLTLPGLLSICHKRRKVLFLLKKSSLQPPEFIVRADPAARRLKRSRDPEALFHILTRVRVTLGTCLNALLFAAFYDLIPAPVLRLAAGTGNLFIRHDMVPIADLRPQLCGVLQFLFRFFIWMQYISRTRRAVISACS